MGNIVERLKDWWLGLDKSQRPVWMLGAGVLTVLLIGAVVFAGRPNMSMLFGGLSPQDQGMIVEELNKLGIPADYDANGNVMVPSNKVNEARAKLAVAKKLPQSGNLGYGTFDSINMTTSPAVEREKIKSAIEGELANTLQKFQGITAARVHLALGDDSPFAQERTPATASIVISEDSSARLTPDQAQAIVRLVQFGVRGLDQKNITVVTDKGNMLFDGTLDGTTNGAASTKIAAENEEAIRRERDLQQKLDSVFGLGNTRVQIPILKLNFDKISEDSIERGPSKKPVVSETVEEKMGNADGGAEGAAGAISNTQQPADALSNPSKNYSGTQTREEFETNEKRTTIQKGSGDLERMSINVMVNSAVIKDVAPIEQIVAGYLGPLSTDSDNFKATVTAVEFDASQKKAAETATAAAARTSQMQQMISMLPIVALLVVGFLVAKSIGKSAAPKMGQQVEVALPGVGTIALPMSTIESHPELRELAQAPGFTPTAPMPQNPTEQVIDIVGGSELAQALHALASNGQAELHVDDIPDKVNIPLEQIKKMAISKPDAVAKLIKTWILEERR